MEETNTPRLTDGERAEVKSALLALISKTVGEEGASSCTVCDRIEAVAKAVEALNML